MTRTRVLTIDDDPKAGFEIVSELKNYGFAVDWVGDGREALDHLEESGVPVRGHMACGDVVDSISTHAGMLDSDILVVGHRTRTGLSRWWNRGVAHDHLMARCNGRLVVSIPCG